MDKLQSILWIRYDSLWDSLDKNIGIDDDLFWIEVDLRESLYDPLEDCLKWGLETAIYQVQMDELGAPLRLLRGPDLLDSLNQYLNVHLDSLFHSRLILSTQQRLAQSLYRSLSVSIRESQLGAE